MPSVRPLRRGALVACALAAALAVVGCGTDPRGASTAPAPAPSTGVVPPSAASSTPTAGPAAPSSARPTPTVPSGTPTRAPRTSATPSPKPTPEPTVAAILSRGESGDQVRELQHRLRQLEWFSGTITGRYGAATVRAVQGFQQRRDLTATGAVDRATWSRLTAMTREPTDAEKHNRLVAGPALLERGSSGDRVRDLQARLKQLGWFAPSVTGRYGDATVAGVKGFQGKREIPVTGEVDRRTLDRLTAMTRTPTADQKHNRTPKPKAVGLDPRCLTGRALCVSKRSNSLVWVIDGQPQRRMDVRFGSDELPTRNGAFRVGWKSRDHVSSIYKTPMPYAMFFSGGQAVHYSPDFAARGYNGASHGCVNVRNRAGIQALFTQVRVGDKVIVYG